MGIVICGGCGESMDRGEWERHALECTEERTGLHVSPVTYRPPDREVVLELKESDLRPPEGTAMRLLSFDGARGWGDDGVVRVSERGGTLVYRWKDDEEDEWVETIFEKSEAGVWTSLDHDQLLVPVD